jgi:hypothetical protein
MGIGSNSPEPLYLRLEDDTGNPGTVYHEGGPEAVLATDWQLWGISLEDFQTKGVNITSVRKIVIGVGDKDNPQLGGTGKLIIDDIHIVRRIPITGSVLLFEEDFENLVLGPSVDEDDAPADKEAWTEIPPSGWIVDDSGVPGAGDPTNDGATEWAGWSFAKKDWWAQIGQDRQMFELANGIVAIADADEWDDFDHPSGMMNALLSTSEIDVTAIESGSGKLQLIFDSSWRREDTQTASVTAQFDDGEPIEILRWESEGGNPVYLKDDAVSETVTVNIDKPAGAKKMVLTFAMLNAGNGWWWAIDNIQINGIPRERTVIFAQDFESLELEPSVEENPGLEEAWTDTPPAGWFVDESAVPGAGDPANDGVTEWAGWSFANKGFWINTDFQRRDEFELGQGTIAVADSDEYADADHPSGSYDTYITTPEINISGVEVGTLQLKFDSSWRPEVIQTANITVRYDDADPEEVLR